MSEAAVFSPLSILIYVFSLLLSMYSMYWSEKHHSKTAACFSVLVLTVLGGFRYGIGTDYFSYETIFYDYVQTGNTNGHFIEPLYCICMLIASYCGLAFTGFIFLIQLLINFVTFFAIHRMKEHSGLWFPWAIFSFRYYLLGYNAIRQAIAMAFVLLALTYFSKSIFKYLLCVFIAMGFHLTAFIALFLVVCRIFYAKKQQRFWYVVIIAGSALLILSRSILISLLQILFPSIGYFAYLASTQGGSSFAGYLFTVIPSLCCVLFAMKKICKKNEYFFFLFVYVLGDILMLTMLFSSNQLARIAFYFVMTQIFVLPYACKCLSDKYNKKILVPYTFFITAFMFAWDFLLLNNGQIMPYRSIFGV